LCSLHIATATTKISTASCLPSKASGTAIYAASVSPNPKTSSTLSSILPRSPFTSTASYSLRKGSSKLCCTENRPTRTAEEKRERERAKPKFVSPLPPMPPAIQL